LKLGDRERADRAIEWLCRHQNPSGGFYGGYGPGADYFPDNEIAWAAKYFLDAWVLMKAAPASRFE
jgi:malonyl-CoA O-methyltransferase